MDSFQNEMPKSRVNIILEIETNEGRRKKELPLKLLVMGNFSHERSLRLIADRERIGVHKENIDQVIKDLQTNLCYTVKNTIKNDGSDLQVNLCMDSMRSFLPEEIVKKIPELRNLLAMRNLLKDLKANLLDNNSLRQGLEKILQDPSQRQALRNQLAPLILSNQIY